MVCKLRRGEGITQLVRRTRSAGFFVVILSLAHSAYRQQYFCLTLITSCYDHVTVTNCIRLPVSLHEVRKVLGQGRLFDF
jgi:hypothetical protein